MSFQEDLRVIYFLSFGKFAIKKNPPKKQTNPKLWETTSTQQSVAAPQSF